MELTNTPLTEKYFADLEVAYNEFNENCAAELVEMNQNVISNIVARGGDAGWEQAKNFDYLKKNFEFTSFEQADAFIQSVGMRAN
jgi:4a-hydroxytetrahydrobiopterin dehydratase